MFTNFILKPHWVRRRALWRRLFLSAVLVLSAAHLAMDSAALGDNTPRLTASVLSRFRRGGDITEPPPILLPPPPPIPVQVGSSTAPNTTAPSVLVKDRASGAVLYHKDGYASRPIASITKLMSAIVLTDTQIDWTATSSVPADDVEDTHMYADDTYTIGDLWHTALIGSSNKAILTLADAHAPTRAAFVERMNQKARELGMMSAVFVEPTGLDDGNSSTASDVAILLREALSRPAIRMALATSEYEIYSRERNRKHHLWNTNWLLLRWVPCQFAVLGGKTGYTTAAGYSVAVEVEDGGRALDIVILGADSHEARFTEACDLAKWAFADFVWE